MQICVELRPVNEKIGPKFTVQPPGAVSKPNLVQHMWWGVLTQSVLTVKPGFSFSIRPQSIFIQSSAVTQTKALHSFPVYCKSSSIICLKTTKAVQQCGESAEVNKKAKRDGWLHTILLYPLHHWGIEWQLLERKALMDESLLRRVDRERCDRLIAVCHLNK